ncbi:hypothetical protein GQ457_15G017350 [Hibiscus cannabinus]
MAFVVDQQSNFKHFCKICKKGFGCGRALGGHMRALGIGDESSHLDDDYPASDWEDKVGRNVPPSNMRMHALRTNPNRLKSCRVCENCGKEFLSWKSFLEHAKCCSEDAESLVSSPGSDGVTTRVWSKRKRSFRAGGDDFNPILLSTEEEHLASCLMMLSNATVDPLVTEPEESCASASKEEERRNTMNFIAPIACKVPMDKAKGVAKGLFECKACKKVFNSHQALGGHRASHKKVKGCFAARLDRMDNNQADEDHHDAITHEEFFPGRTVSTLHFNQGTSTPLASTLKKKSKVHECSICHRVFSSGQALGGHKRCHWINSNAPDHSSLHKFHRFQDQMEPNQKRSKFIYNSEPLNLKLDLNLPAATDHNDAVRQKNVNLSGIDVSTRIYLQPWSGGHDARKKECNQHQLQHADNQNNNANCKIFMQNAGDEADSKVKLTKLRELRDINMSGGSSPWLQVGIGI